MEMKAQIVANVIPIFVALTPSLLHHNNVGVTYPRTSNLKMEPIGFVPLYFMAMPQSLVTIIEVPFITTRAHNVVSMKSKPRTPRETQLVNVLTKMPREVDKIFVG
jgi:hypothetical protein